MICSLLCLLKTSNLVCILKSFLTEIPNLDDLEESANLIKIQADYKYFTGNYENSLEFYKQSLGNWIERDFCVLKL